MNLILVTPHGRSGSLFLQSLFDGHPQVAGFPGLNFRYDFPDEIPNVELAVRQFIQENGELFDSSKGYLGFTREDSTTLLGANQNEHITVDASTFADNAVRYEFAAWRGSSRAISRKEFVVGLHRAYARTIGQDVSKLKFILVHLHSYAGGHDRAFQDFPGLYFLAMVRDPREDWLKKEKVMS